MGRTLTNPLDRRFIRCCQVVACAGVAIYVPASQAAMRMDSPLVKIPMATLAGLAFFSELVAVGLLVSRKMDEFQRVLLVRSFVWATVVTMGLVTVWGFVDLCSHHTLGRVDIIWVPMVLIGITAAAKLLIFRQYKSPVE
jgi:hypothetical protein